MSAVMPANEVPFRLASSMAIATSRKQSAGSLPLSPPLIPVGIHLAIHWRIFRATELDHMRYTVENTRMGRSLDASSVSPSSFGIIVPSACLSSIGHSSSPCSIASKMVRSVVSTLSGSMRNSATAHPSAALAPAVSILQSVCLRSSTETLVSMLGISSGLTSSSILVFAWFHLSTGVSSCLWYMGSQTSLTCLSSSWRVHTQWPLSVCNIVTSGGDTGLVYSQHFLPPCFQSSIFRDWFSLKT